MKLRRREWKWILGSLAALGLLSSSASPSSAAELEGVQFPDHLTIDSVPLALNGLGLRKATVLNVKVYVAGLYLEQPEHDAQRILDGPQRWALVLYFVHDVRRDQMVKAFDEGFEKNAGAEMPAVKARVKTLGSWMEDQPEGSRLMLACTPGRGVTVSVNDRVRGFIPGPDFCRALLSIWLGPSPPNESLKEGLLGNK